jgi:hypothetical protein
MRSRYLSVALATVVTLTACARTGARPPSTTVPAAVSCADALHLRQRAAEDRRKSDASKSDHDKIAVGNRAGFFASLANVADLKCKVKISEADEALKPAFEAARKAEVSRSTYERAQRWSEAAFIATEVIALQIQQLAEDPPRAAPVAH